MMKRWAILTVSLAMAAALIATSCSRDKAPAGFAGGAGMPGGNGRRAAATAVQASLARFGQLSADRDTAGVIAPVLQSQVAAGASGIVAKVLRQAGDWVATGDLVVQIDDATLKITEANAEASLESAKISLRSVQDSTSQSNVKLQLQVDSAQSAYDSAKRYYDSQKALFDLGGISASALDTAKGQLASAQAALEGAKIALDQNEKGLATTASQNVESLRVAVSTAENNLKQAKYNLQNAAIKAPFAGQIASVAATPGMYLGQNTSAFTIVSGERQVSFTIAPSDALAVSPGKALSFELGGKSYPIRVKQAPSLPVNGVVSLIASIAGASDLPFGTVGNVSYVVPLAKGALVPISALDTLDNRNYVFTVEAGKVVTKDVVVLASSGATVAITGIGEGTVVILSPPPGLIDGAAVAPTMVADATAPPAGKAAEKGQAPRQGGRQGQGGKQGQGGPASQASGNP